MHDTDRYDDNLRPLTFKKILSVKLKYKKLLKMRN